MELLLVFALIMALCFGGVLLFGAPYLPSLSPQIRTALDLLDLKPGQTMLELGSGDGKVLLAAAEQGIRVYGYELNPLLVLISWLRTRKYRNLVTIVWGDFWQKKWPKSDGIYVFGLDSVVEKLHKKVVQTTKKPVRIVSVGFEIKTAKLAKKENGVFLYVLKPSSK